MRPPILSEVLGLVGTKVSHAGIPGCANGVTPMNATRESSQVRSFDPSADGQALWSALVNDAGCIVMIVRGDGVVEFANAAAAKVAGVSPAQLQGKTLSALYGDEFAAERLAVIADVLRSGRSVTMEGMSRGKLMRSVYRALPGETGRVLAVCRPATPGEAPDATVIRARVNDRGPLASLTQRELEILQLIGKGLSTAEIAKSLHRSVKTVEWHRVSLGTKLGVTNRVELARIAISAGIVDVNDAAAPVSNGNGNGAAHAPAVAVKSSR